MCWVFKWQTLCFAHYLLQQDGLCLTDSNYSGHNLEGAWTRVAQLIGFGWQWSSVAQKLTSLSFHSQFFGTLKSIGLQLNTIFVIILTADYWSSKLIIFFCFWIIKHLKKCPLQFLNGRQNVFRYLVRWTKSSERKDTQFTVVCVCETKRCNNSCKKKIFQCFWLEKFNSEFSFVSIGELPRDRFKKILSKIDVIVAKTSWLLLWCDFGRYGRRSEDPPCLALKTSQPKIVTGASL